ncbi:hypothetical protein BC826DRAFT_214687 [Russula brevipes]|nr:hypothetical protein BC826DRAFT_214687 [Russula brevipes]
MPPVCRSICTGNPNRRSDGDRMIGPTACLCESATTSAAASTARPPTQLFIIPTAGDCCLQHWKQQERARFLQYSEHEQRTPQRWSQLGRVHVSNSQHQQYAPSVHTSTYRVNQNVYPSRETNHISHLTGGAAVPNTIAHSAPQAAQPPNATPAFGQQRPQYPQYSSTAASGSQVNVGQGTMSGTTTNHGAHRSYGGLDERYASWANAYTRSTTREYIQPQQQGRQMHPTVPISTSPTIAPTSQVSGQNQNQSQSHMPAQGGAVAPSLPHTQTHGLHTFSPMVSAQGQQIMPQISSVARSGHAPLLRRPVHESTFETGVDRPISNTADAADVQRGHPETAASHPVAKTLTDPAGILSALPSSQSGPAQSILLDSEKGAAVYSMRGLAASIKRSLNAERLAASAKLPALSSSPKRSSSGQVIDVDARPEADLSHPDLATGRPYEHEPLPKVEPEPEPVVPEPVIEVDDSPQTVLPVPFSEGSVPQQEIRDTPDGRVTPASHDFVPFSTLAGAVSFDNITDSAPAPGSEAARTPEDVAMIPNRHHFVTMHKSLLPNHPLTPFLSHAVPQHPHSPQRSHLSTTRTKSKKPRQPLRHFSTKKISICNSSCLHPKVKTISKWT